MFIASDGGNIWETPFSLVCQAPVLVYDSNLIDDSFGGNGNGGADPGETIDIYVSLFDDATGEASGIWADLSSSDPYMTITVDHAEYPDVLAGGIGHAPLIQGPHIPRILGFETRIGFRTCSMGGSGISFDHPGSAPGTRSSGAGLSKP